MRGGHVGQFGGVVTGHDEQRGVDVADPLHLPGDAKVHLLPVGPQEPRPAQSRVAVVDEGHRPPLVGRLHQSDHEVQRAGLSFDEHLLARLEAQRVVEQITGQSVQPRVSHLRSFLTRALAAARRYHQHLLSVQSGSRRPLD